MGILFMNIKKTFLVVTGLITVSLVGVISFNSSYPFNSSASGITINGNQRTLTIDTELNIEGKVGTANFGNIAVKSRDCSSLQGGVARLNTGNLLFYCPTAEMVNNYYVGFASSTITGVQMTFNDLGTSRTLRLKWCKFGTNFSPEDRGLSKANKYSGPTEGSNDNQTLTVDSSDFIENQSADKNKGFSCIELSIEDSFPIELYSFTVTYTCL